jgi:DNA modification methylase
MACHMTNEKISEPTQLTYITDLTVRQFNILHSPKNNGSAYTDSVHYLEELGINILNRRQPIQFLPNTNEPVHRWSPYVQGFSAKFVQSTIDFYRSDYDSPMVHDPFAGSGTVLVQSKINGISSYGVELNPLLHFVAETKLNSWRENPLKLLEISQHLSSSKITESPSFLKSQKHFHAGVLLNLEKLKGGIDFFEPATDSEKQIKDLLLLAFASILIDCSNLKRTPCLGYSRSKVVADNAPIILFSQKIEEMAQDLKVLQTTHVSALDCVANVYLANSMTFEHSQSYDLAITSPPYMNGLDYVMNYKIEMGWLGFAENHKQLKKVKDEMVVCDNVSKGLIKNFSNESTRYTNAWIEEIKQNILANIQKRGNYRRIDMPEIVHKYFDDMYKIMENVVGALKKNGRFILVIGDSLIADVYLPTDLIIAKMGQEMGLTIEKIEKARDRHSGQVRSYKLRETVLTLHKE